MKKMRSDCLAIMAVMIALIIFVWTGMAQASAEEDMFTATTQPDALILLDLSGSMDSTPSGGNKYGSSSACTPNLTACAGLSSTYHYSSNTAGNPDAVNCKGAPDRSNYPYSSNSACTADTAQCVGTAFAYPAYPDYPYAHDGTGAANGECSGWTDCNGSYCKSPRNKSTTPKRSCQEPRGIPLCSGGFCKTTKTGCDVNCNVDCSGGFCAASKPGCDVNIGGSCSGGFCQTNVQSDCNVDCSKLAIAKRSIFSFLDDNNDGQITVADKTSLGVRMGYMRWYNCSSSSQEGGLSPTYNYNAGAGCNTLIRGIDSPYSAIYCGDNASCSSSTAGSTTSSTVSGEQAAGYTPIASAQEEAKLYLHDHAELDAAKACRSKFVILITDGADTMACGTTTATTKAPQRRESVAKAKALADAGYKVFVIGFGAAMPEDEKNTLNWMAYYGRTDDPNTANTGSTTAYNLATGCNVATDPELENPTCCTNTNPSACYPSGVASCSTSTSNDPGLSTLGGYAYIAADADALAAALRSTINIIRQANYSFSQASIQASRTQDENFLYEGSFEPADSSEPFWKGHLKKYQIGSDGAVGAVSWDAGEKLRDRTTSRNILTYTGAQTAFNTANITAAHLGVTTDDERMAIIGYVRGDFEYNPEYTPTALPPPYPTWKLGDVFRSTPITVGTPSITFNDVRDCNNQFAAHRTAYPRTSANGRRLIVVGANDGQLHGFTTSDGAEAWSFIPPNLLPKLKNLAHSQHPPNQSHQYFDDGPITVADIWDGTTATGCSSSCSQNGECKAANSWKTLMVFGEGRGAIDYAWSSSASCNTGLSSNYSVTAGTPATTTTYPYYCGYHALTLTDSLNPTYMWHLNFTDATARVKQAPYLGDPWSKMMIGRIKESGNERWVGFIGAGYNGSDCTGSGACDTRGKGFFVVDLTNGNIIWSFTQGSSNTSTTSAAMKYSLPAPPAIVDTDGDGFIDTAYLGDLGGNMWRFAFCRDQDAGTCGISNWSGGKFFDAASGTGNIKSIYTLASVAKDAGDNIWVYWGTGNKIAPTAKTGIQEYFYGVKDGQPAAAYNAGNLTTLAAGATTTFDPAGSNAGYRIQLANPDVGEKVMADPTVFGGIVYFTTYTPSAGEDACNQSGDARLCGIDYTTAAGVVPTDTEGRLVDSSESSTLARCGKIGSGIPSAPVISLKPGTTTSAAAGAAAAAAATAAGASSSAAAAAGAAAAAAASSGGTASAVSAAATAAATAAGASSSAAAAAGAAAAAAIGGGTAATAAASAASAAATAAGASASAAAAAAAAASAVALSGGTASAISAAATAAATAAGASIAAATAAGAAAGAAATAAATALSGSATPDLYVTTSGTGGGITGTTVTSASTQRVNFNPPSPNRTNMIFWRDRRIQ